MNRYSAITPDWADERTVFILGCGPSLRAFDARRIRGCGKVIAINDAFALAPRADILYFCDQKWWDKNFAAVRTGFKGKRIVTLENQIEGVDALRNAGQTGLETDPSALRNGSNSGYQAINLAYHLGAKRIVLLGYDMKVSAGRMHWRERNDGVTPPAFEQTLKLAMLPHFETLKEPLAAAGVEVLNANPDSDLNTWTKIELDWVLQPRTIANLTMESVGSVIRLGVDMFPNG